MPRWLTRSADDTPTAHSRLEAIANGERVFFTGRPCKRGHMSNRLTSNSNCITCRDTVHAEKEKARRVAKRKALLANRPPKPPTAPWKPSPEAYERLKERSRAWHKANKEAHAAHVRLWHKRHPEKRRALKARRRARVKGASGTFSGADVALLLKKQKHRCIYCKASIRKRYHIDHKVAVSKGGSNLPDNLQILCPACNISKGSKDPIVFAWTMGMLL